MTRAIALLILMAALVRGALAHEVRPAYLELRQTSADTYDVTWKVPGRGEDLRLGIYAVFPEDCANVTEPRASMINNAFSERWTVTRPGGLAGGTIRIAGLVSTKVDVLVRLTHLNGDTQVTRLTPSAPSFVVRAAASAFAVARTYAVLGVEHILFGIDHLLFVLGLLFIVGRRWGVMLKTITAFTAAHSVTLALAALGVVHVPSAPVEAVIALSIVFVAAEGLKAMRGSEQPGLSVRAPWVVALAFGLLHGFGFAGALSETGLPANAVPLALLLFNVGVEIGQVLFVVAIIVLMALIRYLRIKWPKWAGLVPPYAIGGCAAFWTIQRTLSVLGV